MIATFDDMGGGGRTRVTIRQHFDTLEKREKFIRMPGVVEGAKQTLDRLAGFILKKAEFGCFPHD